MVVNDHKRRNGNESHRAGIEYGDQRDALAATTIQLLEWVREHVRDIILSALFVLIWAIVFTLLVR